MQSIPPATARALPRVSPGKDGLNGCPPHPTTSFPLKRKRFSPPLPMNFFTPGQRRGSLQRRAAADLCSS